ncbi:MAG: GGDEF domain-containing protein [Bacilli bacterium]|jgi:diguanylate cyclase (GGDEF)-like protein|nr:GGDEF domain-containing protein [Bacilli bacterium]
MNEIPSWLCLDVCSLLLLLFVLISSYKNTESKSKDSILFRVLCYTFIIFVISDAISSIKPDADWKIVLIKIFIYVNFGISPIVEIAWHCFASIEIYPHKKSKTEAFLYVDIALGGIDLILLLLTPFFNLLFQFDANGNYSRGFLFPLHFAVLFLMIATTTLMTFVFRKETEKGKITSLLLFPVIPAFGILLQYLTKGLPTASFSIALSILIVFINILFRSIDVDYLTGAYNRRKLEKILQQKIHSSNDSHSFSAILIDLNDFKNINDTYGHNIGDQALEDTAGILVSCCSPATGLVARYGGDEFCLVSDIYKEEDLKEFVNKIQKALKDFNDSGKRPYKISFAMGYAIYQAESKMSVADFQKVIDENMYKTKRFHHTEEITHL